MSQNTEQWVKWVRVAVDPNSVTRGFSLEDFEFPTRFREPVEDEMHGTLPGDHNIQAGKFWVVPEADLMRICPKMEPFAQSKDWFFPVEFCTALERPPGVEPAQTRVGTKEEKADALGTFRGVQEQLANKA